MGVSLYTISYEPLCSNRKICHEGLYAIDHILTTGAILSSTSLIVYYCKVLMCFMTQQTSFNQIALGASLHTTIITYFHGIVVYNIHVFITRWRDNKMEEMYIATYVVAFIVSGMQALWVTVLLTFKKKL